MIKPAMRSSAPGQVGVVRSIWNWWKQEFHDKGAIPATRALASNLWDFARNSTSSRLRQRYGDADYDWDHRVNTTSAAVRWRERLLGVFHSPYQPTDPELFREMMDSLQQLGVALRNFTFIDLGSGKGRTLLMASAYPFRRIVGVELLPALHAIAQENLRSYHNDTQQCFALDSLCADAVQFSLPQEPLLIYLFNPFPEHGLRDFIDNVRRSMTTNPRPMVLLYHNPVLEHVLSGSGILRKIGGTHQYSIYNAELK